MADQIEAASERVSPNETGAEHSIGEVCARTGLSARTVRYYEELGLLPGVRRRTGGRRVYGGDELERLGFIQRLKTLGLTLHEIKELNSLYAIAGSTRVMLERLSDLLEAHLNGLESRIGELVGLRDEMRRYRAHVAQRIGSDDPPVRSSDRETSTVSGSVRKGPVAEESVQ